MDDQETPLAAASTFEQDITPAPLATSPRNTPSDIPPPAHIPENDSTEGRDDPMELDGDSISVAHPRKDTPEDTPVILQAEPDQLPMATPQPTNVSTPSRGGSASARGSRSNKRVSFPIVGEETPSATTDATPSSAPRGRPQEVGVVVRREQAQEEAAAAVVASESVQMKMPTMVPLQTARPTHRLQQNPAVACRSPHPSCHRRSPHHLQFLRTRRNGLIAGTPKAQSAKSAFEA
jgi:hypothetical protein